MKNNRFLYLILPIGLLLFVTQLLTIYPARSQSMLKRSDPAPDAILDRAPSEIFVWVSEPLSTGSRLTILDEQFQPVDKGQTFIDASDTKLMRAPVKSLLPGRYTVSWKANAVNGRFASGSYDFVVRDTTNWIPLIAIVALVIILIGSLFTFVMRYRHTVLKTQV